jgi:hypothetical protein
MEHIYEPFNVTVSECEQWTNRHRKNTFFELVCILEGEGDQYVNYVRYPYKTNNFFFLPSSKCHTYNIHKKTKFAFIRFTQNYFNNKESGSIDYSIWFNRLNYIIGHYNRTPGELIPDEEDKKNAQLLFQVILNLYQKTDVHSRMILQSSVVALLGIVLLTKVQMIPE